jgi:hypothetical protein
MPPHKRQPPQFESSVGDEIGAKKRAKTLVSKPSAFLLGLGDEKIKRLASMNSTFVRPDKKMQGFRMLTDDEKIIGGGTGTASSNHPMKRSKTLDSGSSSNNNNNNKGAAGTTKKIVKSKSILEARLQQ